MLPFGSYEFFVIMAMYVGLLVLLKKWTADKYYVYVLGVLNLLFIGTYYPQPFHFLLFVAYSYGITFFLTHVYKPKFKLVGILFLLLPMLLVKLDIRGIQYPFELNRVLSFAGLSYASFRIMGYYMDKNPQEKMANVVSYFNFLAFSPTVLIGPIDKYSHYQASENKGFSNITADNLGKGWQEFVKGLAFKFVIAELIDRYWLQLFEADSTAILHMANTMYAYYFYLFFDFAGYSYMALGIGKMLGISVPVNFTNPFVAVNPQDFWRRFHISLGTWLRDYFFSPLYTYFTRKKSLKSYPLLRQNMALFSTFLLMGCWNGFSTNFVLSGALFGLYSVVHNSYSVQCRKKGRDIVFGELPANVVKYASIVILFNLVAFSLYIFSGYCPIFH